MACPLYIEELLGTANLLDEGGLCKDPGCRLPAGRHTRRPTGCYYCYC